MLILAVVLALVDAWITYGRLQVHPSLEINPLVRWLATKMGAAWASLLAVGLLQSLVALTLSQMSPLLLSLLVGASLYRTWTQLYSMKHL